MNNPYSPRYPVHPENFTDRDEIITSFKNALAASLDNKHKRPENIMVLGKSGFGKTSVLRKFEDIAQNEMQDRMRVFSVFVGLSPSSCRDFRTFIFKIRDEIERTSWKIHLMGLEKSDDSLHSDITILEDVLLKLWEQTSLEPTRFDVGLILIDDLHHLLKSYRDGLHDIRAAFQKLAMKGCNYMLCASGPEHMFSEVREHAEPASRFFDRYKLAPFDAKEAAEAIMRPIELGQIDISIDEVVISEIFTLTRGYPYFIHFIMRDIIQSKKDGKVTPDFLKDAWPSIARHLEREKFADEYNFLSETEKKVVLAMAQQRDEQVVLSDLKVSYEILHKLEERDIIVREGRGELCRLYHPLFREYLRSIQAESVRARAAAIDRHRDRA